MEAAPVGLSILSIIGMFLGGVGVIVMMIFGLIILIKAFQESVLWGLGSLFVPFVSLIFVIKFWDRCKKPMIFYLIGLFVFFIGAACLAPTVISASQEQIQQLEQMESFEGIEAIPDLPPVQ